MGFNPSIHPRRESRCFNPDRIRAQTLALELHRSLPIIPICRLFVIDHGLHFGTTLLSGKTSVNLEIRYAARCSLPEIPSEDDVGFARSTTQLRILGAFVVRQILQSCHVWGVDRAIQHH